MNLVIGGTNPSRLSHAIAPHWQGRIGPNAVLQLLPVLSATLGDDETRRLMKVAGLNKPPGDHGLMSEAPAAQLHQSLRKYYPAQAPQWLSLAGLRTADYIIEHRIPGLVVTALRLLPKSLAIRLLSAAIAKHAWTFAGSGTFSTRTKKPLVFALADNPLVRGETSEHSLCRWHEAVFQQLFRSLIDERLRCREVTCCAAGDDACQFLVSLSPR